VDIRLLSTPVGFVISPTRFPCKTLKFCDFNTSIPVCTRGFWPMAVENINPENAKSKIIFFMFNVFFLTLHYSNLLFFEHLPSIKWGGN
jgi:hypothetical protein